MAIPTEVIWEAEPHTLAKHDILKRYLQAWFPIIDSWSDNMIYFDGFCGPGIYKGGETGSPIIALREAANHSRKLTGNVSFIFSDTDHRRIKNLEEEIAKIDVPENFNVSAINCSFENCLSALLLQIRTNIHPPVFALIDPFGFKGIPFKSIKSLMERRSCECLITFMVDSMNRWLDDDRETIAKHIQSAFGTEEACPIDLLNTRNRIIELRDAYYQKLRSIAKFIRHFEMRDSNNRILYYLFFISNHRKGYIKMKEAMWKVEPRGSFSFSDSTDPGQSILFNNEDLWLPMMKKTITEKYAGMKLVDVEDVLDYVEVQTGYLGTHMKKALKELESDNCIVVESQKKNGKKRNRGTFPNGTIISFT